MSEFLYNLSWLTTVFSEFEVTILSQSLNKSSNSSEYESNLCKHDVYMTMTPNLSPFVLFFPFFVARDREKGKISRVTVCNELG